MFVCRYSGAANKNIGDAFLLVWSLADSDIENYYLAQQAKSIEEATAILEKQEGVREDISCL